MDHSTDQKFLKFHDYVVWSNKTAAALVYFVGVTFLFSFWVFFFPADNSCDQISDDFIIAAKDFTESTIDMHQIWCAKLSELHIWSISWVIAFCMRLALSVHRFFPLLNMVGIKPVNKDDTELSVFETLKFGVIEWAPIYLGAIYVVVTGVPENLFSQHVLLTLVLGAQFIVTYPFLYKSRRYNLSTILASVKFKADDKLQAKIKKKYNSKLNRFSFYIDQKIHNFIVGISFLVIAFLFVQLLRIPDLNPLYQEKLYGGYEPHWENNAYFAAEGLTAPENVEDFYAYGLKKAVIYFKEFEKSKARSGVSEDYLYDIPQMDLNPIVINKEDDLKLNSVDWKELSCLYYFDHENPTAEGCATFSDVKKYIEDNQLMWDRFNQIPAMGFDYYATPQFLGADMGAAFYLVDLKAAEIVMRAKNGQVEQAMTEWLSFTELYIDMLNSRASLVYKAQALINMTRHYSALEYLLSIEPQLAATFQDELISVLKDNLNYIGVSDWLAQDIGSADIFLISYLGNVNAMQNEVLKCIQNFEALAQISPDKYPYASEDREPLCFWDDFDRSSSSFMSYPLLSPGSFRANLVYSLMMGGLLKGEELIASTKRYEAKLRMIQLGINILSDKPADIEEYIFDAQETFLNPITNKPYQWDAEKNSLYFESPVGNTPIYFHLNLAR